MEPIKITEEMREDLIDAKIVAFQSPEGDEDHVETVEGLFELGVPGRFGPDRIYIPLRADDEDLKRLAEGKPLWLVILGHRMPVFQTYIQDLPGDPHVLLVGGPHDGMFIARAEARDQTGELSARLHLDATGSIYELAGARYEFVEDGAPPIGDAGTEVGP